MKTFDKIWAAVLRFIEATCAVLVLLIAAIVGYEIVARWIFNAPTTWAQECAVYLLIALAFFGLAPTDRAGEHIQIDLLTKRLSSRVRIRLQVLTAGAVAAFACIAVWGGWELVAQSLKFGRRSLTLLAVPVWIPQMILPLGMTLLAIAMIWRICRLLIPPEENESPR